MLKDASAEELLAADATHVRGGYHQVRGDFLERDGLQDAWTPLQQLKITFFGREAVEVEVARIGLQEKLLGIDAGGVGLLSVKGGKPFGGTNIDFAPGQGLYVSLRAHTVDAGGIVGYKLVRKSEARVVRTVFGPIEADVLEDARFDESEIRKDLALLHQEFVFLNVDEPSVADA